MSEPDTTPFIDVADAMRDIEYYTSANPRLVNRGRLVNAQVMVLVGEQPWLLSIQAGHILSVKPGPFVMPSTTFRLSAPLTEWQRFWLPVPPPGSHDLLALLKRRVLKIDGDLHLFMTNLLYFKQLLAAPREHS